MVNTMLVSTLQACGFEAWAVQSLEELRDRRVDVIVVSALPPLALLPARSLCRKIHKMHRDLKVVLGVWNSENTGEDIRKRMAIDCIDSVVTSLQGAVERVSSELEIPSLESV